MNKEMTYHFARVLASDCDVTMSVTCRISSNTKDNIDLGVDFTIFEVEELENEGGNDVLLTCDLSSDCDITMSVTCRINLF